MSKTIAVVQSNYIPWRGYFDLIHSVDEFILYDDVQYTIRDWRNRNIIKTQNGPRWLTIPVEVKAKYLQKIKDAVISDPTWGRKHWAAIIHNYSRAKYFPMHRELFEDLYLRSEDKLLSHINYRFIVAICQILGISTTISWSMGYDLIGDKTERLVHLCLQAGATRTSRGLRRRFTSMKIYSRVKALRLHTWIIRTTLSIASFILLLSRASALLTLFSMKAQTLSIYEELLNMDLLNCHHALPVGPSSGRILRQNSRSS